MAFEKNKILKTSVFYGMLAFSSLAVFTYINSQGSSLYTNQTAPIAAPIEQPGSLLFHFLLAFIIIVVATRVLGWCAQKIHQPAVIGEIIGGILLGPSFLGYFFPHLKIALFPAETMPMINTIAQLGIIFYMYFVGLEIDLKSLRKSAHNTIVISHASIVIPFLLGSLLALFLFQSLAPKGTSFTGFILFFGVSLSITAFPVLARILTDKKLNKTELGSLALACAAIDDVTAWCILAFVTCFAQSSLLSAYKTVAWTFVFILVMIKMITPILRNKFFTSKPVTSETKPTMLIVFPLMVLASAATTEYIGIHALFGAFFLGAITPKENSYAKKLEENLHEIISFLFLPAFFAFTGMRTQINLINDSQDWLICLLIIAAAVIGKMGGTIIAARFVGLNFKKSLALGVLMNTRGLVELIVLNIGLDLGIISERLFAMLVIMALVTTIMTGPALRLIKGFESEAA